MDATKWYHSTTFYEGFRMGRSGFQNGAFWFPEWGVLETGFFTEMGARMGRSGFQNGAFWFSVWGVLDPFGMNSIPNKIK